MSITRRWASPFGLLIDDCRLKKPIDNHQPSINNPRGGAHISPFLNKFLLTLALQEVQAPIRCINSDDIPERPTQKAMLHSYVTRAIAGGELPKATDPDMVTNMLIAILSGVMMTVLETTPGQMRSTYRRMLRFLWQGVRAEETTRGHVFQEQSINDNASKHAWKGTYLV